MNAPENIYIVQWPSRQSPGGKWHTEIPVIPHPEWIYQYIRHDIHAAVVAERNELRSELDRLHARLDAAMEWVPVAEAGLQDGDRTMAVRIDGRISISMLDFFCDRFFGLHFNEKFEKSDISHIMRIKPPAARGE